MDKINLIDCTLRDGGYYNDWDFSSTLINDYLEAMKSISVDFVELGFRTLNKAGYRGCCGYTTDSFLRTLKIPSCLQVAVMVNGGELVKHPAGAIAALQELFAPSSQSPVTLVRIACHMHELESVMPGVSWLKENGYLVGVNVMQIAERTDQELADIAQLIGNYPADVLYFADSMGSLSPEQASHIVSVLRKHWSGPLGIHAHDNMNHAVDNSLRVIEDGVSWVDATVTGMGRGPGNAQVEYLVMELEKYGKSQVNLTKLLKLINDFFKPLQEKHGWGSNAYYFLAGKYSIHPTYIQEMLKDSRYDESDILAVIEHLRTNGGSKYSSSNLEKALNFFKGEPSATWAPIEMLKGKDVLILGTGPGVRAHSEAIEAYIQSAKPIVVALNTQKGIKSDLIDLRAACHPMRLLADLEEHVSLPQPLVTPLSQLPPSIKGTLEKKQVLDFGVSIENDKFAFAQKAATLPKALVIAYALSLAASGQANRILLAGFDGYEADDPRNIEMDKLLESFMQTAGAVPILAITPTKYQVPKSSVYSLV